MPLTLQPRPICDVLPFSRGLFCACGVFMACFSAVSAEARTVHVGQGAKGVAGKQVVARVHPQNNNGVGLTSSQLSSIVSAIYRVEGGDKTRYPYGVMSVHVDNKPTAKRVCENTVRNNFKRFTKLQQTNSTRTPTLRTLPNGVSLEFVNFLADRYCPPSVDAVGNIRWKKNMASILRLK